MDLFNQLKNKALNLTTNPGVYLMKNKKEEVVYVGKAKNLKNRVVSYFRNLSSHNEKVKKMIESVEDFDFFVTKTEFEALILECNLIKEYKPKYNILLKDSKGYKYIKISNEDFPKIKVCSKKIQDNAKYIGPYVSSFSVKQAVDEVNKVFMLPRCNLDFSKNKKNKRPCLNYYIKQCMGFCKFKISKQEYLKIVKEAINYIKHGDIIYLKKLKNKMKEAAKKEDFENAIKLRDKIKSIEKIHQTQKIFLTQKLNADVIAYSVLKDEICFVILKFKNGRMLDKQDFTLKNITGIENTKEEFFARYYYKKEDIPKNIFLNFELLNMNLYEEYLKQQANHEVLIKIPKKGIFKDLTKMAYENSKEILSLKNKLPFKENKTLKELQQILNLKSPPNYIEAYDISNLGDTAIVGGMIVLKDGVFFKQNYRKFKIKSTATRDDYKSMQEVLTRRIKEFFIGQDNAFKVKPNLIFLDGGKGHLLAVEKILKKENFNVSCFGLVKNEKHKTRAIISKEGEISINPQSNVFLFLESIQNKVHNFTISFQKKIHEKNTFKLNLTKIPGIGTKKALTLLTYFDSEEKIKNSSPEEISKICKISQNKAKEILNLLNE